MGGFINIWGILPSVSQLPTPASLGNLTVAYLVGPNQPYDLYIQVGETSSVASWTNTGPFNAGTLVYVNGIGQNVWDADTKVTRLTPESGDRIYYQSGAGIDGYLRMAASPTASTVAFRTTGGQLRVGTATMDDAAVPLSQVRSMASASGGTTAYLANGATKYFETSPIPIGKIYEFMGDSAIHVVLGAGASSNVFDTKHVILFNDGSQHVAIDITNGEWYTNDTVGAAGIVQVKYTGLVLTYSMTMSTTPPA